MEIRKAADGDLPQIITIYNQAVVAGFKTADTEPWELAGKQAWFQLHQQPEYPLFVAVEDGAVIGYVVISAYRPGRGALALTKEISYYIHKDYLRRGYGLQLIQHAIAKADEYSATTLIAIVLDANTASIALLQKAGFEQWGHLPNIAMFNGVGCGHLYFGKRSPQAAPPPLKGNIKTPTPKGGF